MKGSAVMKKINSITKCMIAILILLSFSVVAFAADGVCGDNARWSYENGILTISGSGEMDEYEYIHMPWKEYRSVIKKVVIEDGITKICDDAFHDCIALENVEISDSVTWISEYSFAGCTSLKSIRIPVNVSLIEPGAFANCMALEKIEYNAKNITSVHNYPFDRCGTQGVGIEVVFGNEVEYIPANLFDSIRTPPKITRLVFCDGIEKIGASAFENCSTIVEAELPETLKSIGKMAFFGCTGLQEIVIPDSVLDIGTSAFATCSGLKKVHIGRRVYEIGNSVFSGCSSVTTITGMEHTRQIGDKAFYGCGIEYVSLPECEAIGSQAFDNCQNLKEVVLSKNIATIEANAFNRCGQLEKISIPAKTEYAGNIKKVFFEGTGKASELHIFGKMSAEVGERLLLGKSVRPETADDFITEWLYWDDEKLVSAKYGAIECLKAGEIEFIVLAGDATDTIKIEIGDPEKENPKLRVVGEIVNGEKKWLQECNATELLEINFNVMKNDSIKEDVCFRVACFNKQGRMLTVYEKNETLTDAETAVKIELKNLPDETYRLEIMAWEQNGMTPLMSANKYVLAK